MSWCASAKARSNAASSNEGTVSWAGCFPWATADMKAGCPCMAEGAKPPIPYVGMAKELFCWKVGGWTAGACCLMKSWCHDAATAGAGAGPCCWGERWAEARLKR